MRTAHGKLFPPPRRCDSCTTAAALLFCRPESTFLCIACDARAHAAVRHDRVWMCDVCEQSPAAVACRADAAALCVSCDCDIHSANPLASRHERIPVSPFYDTAESVVVKSAAAALFDGVGEPAAGYDAAPDLKVMELFLQDSVPNPFDNYQISSQPFIDSVVPVRSRTPAKPPVQAARQENRFEIDFTRSIISSYNSNYAAPSLSHSVSSSSMDVGVVPDGSSLSETSYSYPFSRATNPSLDPSYGKTDREARVLRYKEKRKNRKFEKTVRYASRKAYAETRPRIKGRFAKRTDAGPDVDRIFSANFIGDSSYGVVPSF